MRTSLSRFTPSHLSIAGLILLFGAIGCQKSPASNTHDLTADLDRAAAGTSETPSDLALAPAGPKQTTVSAIEQAVPPRVLGTSKGKSVTAYTVASHPTPEVAPVATTVADEPAPPETQEVAPTVDVAADAPAPAPRPHPVPIDNPSAGTGTLPIPGSGTGVWGVIFRGGTVDGDHCDPRAGRRGGGHIAVNNRIPSRGRF